ncbi:MAG: hypothetical protein Q7T71_06750 [Herbiconiux sp.]|nr:hypothetical protein [Herbiconiux sp.]
MTPRRTAARAAFTPPSTTYRTDEQIESLVDAALGTAMRRQLWLMFFDDGHRPKPLVIPVDALPHPLDDAALTRVAVFAREAGMWVGARRVVVTWERPGPAEVTAEEEREFDRLAERFAATPDVSLRAQLVSHSVGVRLVRPSPVAAAATAATATPSQAARAG